MNKSTLKSIWADTAGVLTARTRFESAVLRDALMKMGMNEGWSESRDKLAELLAAT